MGKAISDLQAVMERIDDFKKARAQIPVLKKAIAENEGLLALLGDLNHFQYSRQNMSDELQKKNAQYRLKIVELTNKIHSFDIVVSSLRTPYREILEYRFIDGLKWHEVEEIVNLCQRQCIRISHKILPMLAAAMQEQDDAI